MALSIGVLIIGSLYWEPERAAWRDSRLDMTATYDVEAPIRYGRLSIGRDNTYTMVFSRSCPPGHAKVVRCRREVETGNDLIGEAEHLWTAERNRKPNGRVAANWGCVALLWNPASRIPETVLNGWAIRVSADKDYGSVPQLASEGILVSDEGLLNIPWPVISGSDRNVPMDLLLATATHPNLGGEPKSYPHPAQIAAAWRSGEAVRNNRVAYFLNNVANGITTFEDYEISRLLRD